MRSKLRESVDLPGETEHWHRTFSCTIKMVNRDIYQDRRMSADLSNLEIMIQNLGESTGSEGQKSLKNLMGGGEQER